jgi:hypothetical protein
MNVNQFHNLEHAVGTRFLEYVLNYQGELVRHHQLDEYGFTPQQIAGADQLLSLLAMSYAATPGSALLNYPSLVAEFNRIRQQLGGVAPCVAPAADPILGFLVKRAVEYYPILLLKEDERGMATWGASGFSRVPSSRSECKEVAQLISSDPNLRSLLKGEGEAFTMRVEYALDNSIRVSSLLLNFCGDFLHGVFAVCCYRGKYSLRDVLKEVEASLLVLRRIARGEQIALSYFRGIYGIRMDHSAVHDFGKGAVLRNIDDLANPLTQGTVSTGATDLRSGILLGCVLEYHEMATPVQLVNSAEGWSFSWVHFEKLADDLVMSVVLGGQHKQAPVGKTFTDIYVPLYRHLPSIRDNVRGGITCLNEAETISVSTWFNLLRVVDVEHVRIPLQRIQVALYERTNPVDALLDFFIAWESMFSSETSTRQSVTRSIEAIFVRSGRMVDRKRLKQLYDLRSAIVHGGSKDPKDSELETPESIERVREEVAEIAIATLSQLLKEPELLPLKPRERVQFLLEPTVSICTADGCKCKQLKFKD